MFKILAMVADDRTIDIIDLVMIRWWFVRFYNILLIIHKSLIYNDTPLPL
jgi:hypothetical protein